MSAAFLGEFRPVPGSPHERYIRERLAEVGRWGDEPLASVVQRHAAERGSSDAFVSPRGRMSWAQYDEWSGAIAKALMQCALVRGERVACLMPDGPAVHAVYVGVEKAGGTIVGIGPRAGPREIEHLIRTTGASILVTAEVLRDQPAEELFASLQQGGTELRAHLVVEEHDGVVVARRAFPRKEEEHRGRIESIAQRVEVGDIWLINSTSGTTGMPKCVVHNQNRWLYYHSLAVEAGGMTADDVFMSLIPAPFGFGIWTAHVTPALLGAPTVVLERFSPEAALTAIQEEGVTVLACVSTQFIMMLGHPELDRFDLTSLRCMFTGGEAVPAGRARDFESRTGAKVLQFYGSNETGALSRTSLRDAPERRHLTAGRVIESMDVRLFDDAGRDATEQGGPGQAGCAGPATCLGYYADDRANAELITGEGWMLTGDVCTLDADGYLTVVGRKSDFIIRGGKNISAAAVEEAILSHPAVRTAAAIAMPDEVFGERVCVYAEVQAGEVIELPDLLDHLRTLGVSKELWPERLESVDELPRASGGKIAKAQLRDDIRDRLKEERQRLQDNP